jgi:hypothetical protein
MELSKQVFETLGNIELLSQKRAAVFASQKTPAELHGPVISFLDALKRLPIALAGGWQSPLEKKILNQINSSGSRCNIIHYLAKNINNFKPGEDQNQLVKDGRMLFISPGIQELRPSQRQINSRDELIFSQIDKILFIFIAAGGRLEEYFNRLLSASYQVFLFEHPLNKEFFNSSAVLLNEDNAELLLGSIPAAGY